MASRHRTAADYSPSHLEAVRTLCLHVASRLGDAMDRIVVVGGLAPSLLVGSDPRHAGLEAHIGTRDLDVGASLGFHPLEDLESLLARLREAGMVPVSAGGRLDRWRYAGQRQDQQPPASEVLRDVFPLPRTDASRVATPAGGPSAPAPRAWPELLLAFDDRQRVHLEGTALTGEPAAADVRVCGPGAFTVIKSLAFDQRGVEKDAYDMYYVVRNFGSGVGEVAARLAPLLHHAESRKAMTILERDFADDDASGPSAVASFLGDETSPEVRADVAGFVRQLLQLCGVWPP